MALDIPNTPSGIDTLFKGIETGSDLIHKMMLNKYYNTLHPSGDVANAMYVEQLRQQFGDNDPRYIQAKRAHDLALQGRQSLIGYRDILNQTAGVRYSSPLGKEIAEGKGRGAQDILSGNQGGGGSAGSPPPGAVSREGDQYYDAQGNPVYGDEDNNPRTPEEREAYMRSINKKTSDADTRKRLRFAENLDITRNAINKDDLTRYSGPQGTLKLMAENIRAFKGDPSDEYLAYNNAINSASLMAKQMRQFYGESIQPSAMQKLEALSNPSTWYKNPKVAQAQWDSLNKILDAETGTYKKYGTSPIQLGGLNYKNGQFIVGNNQGKQAQPAAESGGNEGNEGGSYDLNAVVPQLMQIDPRYTKANILSTAKETGKTVDQVIYELYQRARKRGQ